MTNWVTRLLPPLLVFVMVSLLAEGAIRAGLLSQRLVPLPSDVFFTLRTDPVIWPEAGKTLQATVIGFLLSLFVGMSAAVVLSASRWVQRAFYPYTVFFQTVPIVAIAPMLVIWIGYGTPAVVASAFVVSIFPVIANTLTGLLATDPALIDLFRLYNAGQTVTLWKLKFPWALPFILTGWRIAAGLAVIGAIVGEFVGGGGLGMYIQTAMRAQSPEKVFAAVLLASFLGLTLVGAVNLPGYILLRRWHASEQP